MFFIQDSRATHIIGGEIIYRCLGDSTYEISLVIYRDCFYGVPYFDNPASIGFFDSENQLIREIGNNGQLLMFVRNDDTLSPILDDKCFVIPPDVCVHTTTYLDTLVLPFREGGYFLSYQRCCRNETIVNIVDPDNAGASFTARINEKALRECNNSAVFNEWPPIYICANTPINFDHSATDVDGDSLVYKLCEPLTGVFPGAPRPQPPNAPPYDPVEWNEPLFSFDNKLGGLDPLTIDAETGLITGIPTIIGQFVVGVCVEEYRNGELISTTNRDFQYNVGVCQASTAAFFTAEFYCDQLEVSFENLSDRSLGSIWYFGGIDNPIDSSTALEPSFIFPDFGTYEVTLVSIGNNPDCNDTITQSLTLLDINFDVDIEIERGECSDTLDLKLIAFASSDTLSGFSYLWEVSWGNQKVFSIDPVFEIAVSNVRQVEIRLRVVDEELGCRREAFLLYETDLILEDSTTRNIILCTRDTIDLFPDFYSGNSYLWSPEGGLLDPPDSPNPRVAPDTATSYMAEVFNENCSGTIFVNIGVYKDDFQLAPDTICGTRTVNFSENPFAGFADITFWRFRQGGVNVGASLQPFPTFTFSSFGDKEVILIPIRPYGIGCPDTLRQNIFLFDLDIQLQPTVERVECTDSLLVRLNAGIQGEIIGSHEFIWIIDGVDTLFNRDSIIELIIKENRLVEVEVLFRNDFGCSSSASFSFQSNLLPQLSGYEKFAICKGDSIQLKPPIISGILFSWDRTDFFISPENSAQPWVQPDTSIVYKLESRFQDCIFSYYFDIDVWSFEGQLVDYLFCDSVLLQTIELPFDEERGIQWFIGEPVNPIFEGNELVFTVDFPEYGSYPLYVIIQDSAANCSDTLFANISIFDISAWEAEIVIVERQCIGDSINIVLTSNILGDFTSAEDDFIIWLINGDSIEVIVGDSVQFGLRGNATIEIELLISDVNECSKRAIKILEFDFIESDGMIDSLSICLGDSIRLLPGHNPEWNYIWSPATGLLDGVTTANPLASPPISTLYTAEISSESCIDFQQVYVEVFDLPLIIEANAVPPIINFGEESVLSIRIEGNITSVLWSPAATLDNPFSINPIASPAETTTYTVIIETDDGCVSSAQVTVSVLDLPCEEPFIFIPNAFSPNGDGLNDQFRIRSVNIDRMLLKVYNRWGQEVFRTSQLDIGWNGTFKGRDMPPDVYAWHLEADCIGGDRFVKKGNVTLIR